MTHGQRHIKPKKPLSLPNFGLKTATLKPIVEITIENPERRCPNRTKATKEEKKEKKKCERMFTFYSRANFVFVLEGCGGIRKRSVSLAGHGGTWKDHWKGRRKKKGSKMWQARGRGADR